MKKFCFLLVLLTCFSAGAFAAESPLVDGRYRDNKDGTVTDTKTGLTWMRCSLGRKWDGATCTYERDGLTWVDAEKAARAQVFAGKSDWRLPTLQELSTLVYCSSGDQMELRQKRSRVSKTPMDDYEGKCQGTYANPTINQTVFPESPQWTWTSTASPVAAFSHKWAMQFTTGGPSRMNMLTAGGVRLVRGKNWKPKENN